MRSGLSELSKFIKQNLMTATEPQRDSKNLAGARTNGSRFDGDESERSFASLLVRQEPTHARTTLAVPESDGKARYFYCSGTVHLDDIRSGVLMNLTQQIHIRISAADLRMIETIAESEGTKPSAIIRRVLKAFINRRISYELRPASASLGESSHRKS